MTVRASDARYASTELVAMEARIVERAVSGGFEAPARLPAQVLAGFVTGPAPRSAPRSATPRCDWSPPGTWSP